MLVAWRGELGLRRAQNLINKNKEKEKSKIKKPKK